MATCHVAAAAMLHDEDALGRTSCRLEGASIDTSAGDVSWSKRVHPSATRALTYLREATPTPVLLAYLCPPCRTLTWAGS